MLIDAGASAPVLVGSAACGLHYEYICAAHVLLNLHIGLAVGEADYLRLPALHSQELTYLVSQRLIRSPAEDFELLIHPCARLAIRLLVGHGRNVLFHLLGFFRR